MPNEAILELPIHEWKEITSKSSNIIHQYSIFVSSLLMLRLLELIRFDSVEFELFIRIQSLLNGHSWISNHIVTSSRNKTTSSGLQGFCQRAKVMPRVRIELTTFRLWDWHAAYCAIEALKIRRKGPKIVGGTTILAPNCQLSVASPLAHTMIS